MKIDLSQTEAKTLVDTFMGTTQKNVDLQVQYKLLEAKLREAENKLHAKERELSNKSYELGEAHRKTVETLEEKIAGLQGRVDAIDLNNKLPPDPVQWTSVLGPLLRDVARGNVSTAVKYLRTIVPDMNDKAANDLANGYWKAPTVPTT